MQLGLRLLCSAFPPHQLQSLLITAHTIVEVPAEMIHHSIPSQALLFRTHYCIILGTFSPVSPARLGSLVTHPSWHTAACVLFPGKYKATAKLPSKFCYQKKEKTPVLTRMNKRQREELVPPRITAQLIVCVIPANCCHARSRPGQGASRNWINTTGDLVTLTATGSDLQTNTHNYSNRNTALSCNQRLTHSWRTDHSRKNQVQVPENAKTLNHSQNAKRNLWFRKVDALKLDDVVWRANNVIHEISVLDGNISDDTKYYRCQWFACYANACQMRFIADRNLPN